MRGEGGGPWLTLFHTAFSPAPVFKPGMQQISRTASQCFNSADRTNLVPDADLKDSYLINPCNIFIGVLKLSVLKEAMVGVSF